jgi:tetratricopeptide (TPR) repeat protein
VHTGGLKNLAWINWRLGDYSTAQILASEAQRVAQISADLYREAQALNVGATCNQSLGNYKQSLFLCDRARNLLSLCGLTGHDTDHEIMITQAEIHKLKSEYIDAHSINTRILQEAAATNVFLRALTLLNIADIEVSMGASKDDVHRNCDAARKLFNSLGYVTGATICDTILAALCLREGDLLTAKTIFTRCAESTLKSCYTVWSDSVISVAGLHSIGYLVGQQCFWYTLSD